LPTEIIPSQILSELADGKIPSAMPTAWNFFWKLQRRDDVDFIQTNLPTEIPRDSNPDSQAGTCRYHRRNQWQIYRRNIPSMSPSVKTSIYCLCRHSLFLSSSVSPSSSPSSTSHLSPPKLQPTTHLNSPLFSTQASTQVSYTFVCDHNIR